MAVKLLNPKHVLKHYEQMTYPGQGVQIDVKFVPSSCLVGESAEEKFCQYTFLDEYSHFRYLEALKEHSTYSFSQLIKHVAARFPYAIECVQTDNGPEFTNCLVPNGAKKTAKKRLPPLDRLFPTNPGREASCVSGRVLSRQNIPL